MKFPQLALNLDYTVTHKLARLLRGVSFPSVAFLTAITLVVLCAVVGLRALVATPILMEGNREIRPHDTLHITKIHSIELGRDFFKKLPSFLPAEQERGWWRKQKIMSGILSTQQQVKVDAVIAGEPKQLSVQIEPMSFFQAFSRIGHIYFVSIIYLIIAAVVFLKHRDDPGIALVYFLASCALYFVTAAPMVMREVTLNFPHFSMLAFFNVVAMAGFITFVHYAFLFPFRRAIADKILFPVEYWLYGYLVVVIVLYLWDYIAFRDIIFMLLVWSVIAAISFLHAIFTERNKIVKKQIIVVFASPLGLAGIIAVFYLLPGETGNLQVQFIYVSLITLAIPLLMVLAMDNVKLIHPPAQQEASEQLLEHPPMPIINRMNNITALSDAAIWVLDNVHNDNDPDPEAAESHSRLFSMQLNQYIHAIADIQHWQGLFDLCKRYGDMLFEGQNVKLEFVDNIRSGVKPPSRQMRTALFNIFVEIINNAHSYSHAEKIYCLLAVNPSAVMLEVRDDGIGCDIKAAIAKSSGLRNVKRRVEEFKGKMQITSKPDQGLRARIGLPII